ncbi:phosphoribosyltransferase [Natrialbaceae archaeon AArc-T1-2]|uniref:phosphoribosyltransferase n=1 Tax=Natrialbaceae archaeon AArc-T1-2 TaxID=3053904 RepID=UPI00255B0026|nr:phosphoribosyltransferase family protein [Natrialbaceae archaeon AArc-T1-2]WIV68598.1 phosphoribosyltransferase family protein [Natrialbaceae archaeon AArc-T1-2]
MFRDRTEAGRELGTELEERGLDVDVVLGIPRGALPVARPVADALEADLDVVVASKIGAPGNPELAIGAVASDGSVWRNESLIQQLGVPDEYVDEEAKSEAEYAREKAERYRDDGHVPDLEGRRIVVVDDGVATGATARACLRQVHEADAGHVVLAVPVAPPDSLSELEAEADEVVALETPRDFGAVGRHYSAFPQVSDEEAIEYLEE